jgi:ribosomal protein S18 acetylase RimI-like enzyme
MEVIVPLNPKVHKEEFRQLCLGTFAWHSEQLWDNYQIDTDSLFGHIVPELVEDQLESYLGLKPLEDIVLILEVEGEAAGMIAITKLSDDTGELHRMWNRPEYRGRGFGRKLLNSVLEAGRGLGCSSFKLSTPRFALAAQHLYRSVGFTEGDEYPESEVHPELRQYWICLEKKG